MDDLKSYMELDDDKINKSLKNKDKLGKLSYMSRDVNYWREKFKYNGERCALENFLLYKVAGAFNLYKSDVDDADITKQTLDKLKEKLECIESVEKVVVGKDIDLNEKRRAFRVYLKNQKEIYLESDTANSLSGDLFAFFRIVLRNRDGRNWFNKYIDMFELDDEGRGNSYYSPFRNYYFYTLISELKDTLRGIEKECLEELEVRAKSTHTLNNMLLVPYGYNAPRGIYLSTYQSHQRIRDRLDLTMKDFKEMQNDTDKNVEDSRRRMIRSENRKRNFTAYSVKFLLDNRKKLFPSKIPYYTEEAMKEDVGGILERTRIINAVLKE